jgi:hypothetical protein
MNLASQTAKHIRDIHFGGNWTTSNIKDTLSDISWQQAITKIGSFNTIATLVFHMNYFVSAVLEVLQGRPLNAHDKFSFNHPPINSGQDWQNLIDKTLNDAEKFANLVEKLPEIKFWDDFTDKKYGNYYRNFQGIVEHCHYHLGQIVILKKLLNEDNKS